MKMITWLALALAAAIGCSAVPTPACNAQCVADMAKKLDSVLNVLEGLSRQTMLQQFYAQEKVRSDGNSGFKASRLTKDGTKNYYQPAIINGAYLSMHDHADFDRTVGAGEYLMVMNGVEFKTRHNDYNLRMPVSTKAYHKTEPVPFPDVPPSVLNKPTVQEQIVEMQKYFDAFNKQDVSIRDYRPYFKPVLCYMEGAWKIPGKSMEEAFHSDRHFLDAKSWFDMMDKIRFTSYTGSKDPKENFAFLPTMIYNVTDGFPRYAQWHYRILCHPIGQEIPTKWFIKQNDLMDRLPKRKRFDQQKDTRNERFYLDDLDGDHYNKGHDLIDRLMMEIPGKDNYGAELYDTSMFQVIENVRFNNHTRINTGYYHRYYKTLERDAMGIFEAHRGFTDANMFVAQTSQPQIAPIDVNKCKRVNGKEECKYWRVRYSYALPMEVVYMTPLAVWNPYNLKYNSHKVIKGNGARKGGFTNETAYNGLSPIDYFYQTPVEFYSYGDPEVHPADTAKKGVGVLDQDGVVRATAASGPRITTPEISNGVGKVRLRYPIMPVHGEGSAVWKELNALKEMTMHSDTYANLFNERPVDRLTFENTKDRDDIVHWQMSVTDQDPPGKHTHDVILNLQEWKDIKRGNKMIYRTSTNNGHYHVVKLANLAHIDTIRIIECDGEKTCWDGHTGVLKKVRKFEPYVGKN